MWKVREPAGAPRRGAGMTGAVRGVSLAIRGHGGNDKETKGGRIGSDLDDRIPSVGVSRTSITRRCRIFLWK